MRILVAGGAGFVGSALVRHLLSHGDHDVTVLDALTYAGSWDNLPGSEVGHRLRRVQGDIGDRDQVRALLRDQTPDAVINLAAETHVDRSIDGPGQFVTTNVLGVFTLLNETLRWWGDLASPEKEAFRFVQVSTDEVFGALGEDGKFDEASPYDPRSPYSATKAGGDHLVRAWGHTYGLPVMVTHCSNNYGPRQYPEKLIPLTVHRAISGLELPVFGDGGYTRDWLAVEDHAAGLATVLERGRPQATYMFGGAAERTNLQVVTAICDILDRLAPTGAPHARLIAHVTDRPGHDRRYAVDFAQTARELEFRPSMAFEAGLERTVRWYLDRFARDGVSGVEVTERQGLAGVTEVRS